MTNLLLLLAGAVLLGDPQAPSAPTNAPSPSVFPMSAARERPPATGNTNDPVEIEYKKLLLADDEAQAEADRWIRENEEFATKGAGLSPKEMSTKIRQRFAPVRKGYEDFLANHPKHVRARIAFASFLGDLNDEEASQVEYEKALALETNNPAIYNNLANIYGHTGPVKKAFEFYARAIALNPNEPVYYHNFGTTVFLFRTDAKEFYSINEQQVFDKALDLYNHALKLAPADFELASDVAQTYYGIKPLRLEPALRAWTNALNIATTETERQGVHIHFARLKLRGNLFVDARHHLELVTLSDYAKLKERVGQTINDFQAEWDKTNAAPAAVKAKEPGGQ